MNPILTRAVAIAAVSIMVVRAFAQGGGGGGRGGRGGFGGQRMGMGGGDTQLLNRKDVGAELKITAEQKTKVDAALEKMRADRRAAMQGGGGNFRDMSDADRQKMQEKNAEEEKKVLESVLTKEQVTRLKELGIQRAGNAAILRPEVQKELVITEDQKKKIADLQAKQREAMQSMFQNGGFQDMSQEERQAAMAKMQETQKKNTEIMNTELGKILTPEQAAKLKTMGGAPFKFDPAEDNNRGGRGGGGRGGL